MQKSVIYCSTVWNILVPFFLFGDSDVEQYLLYTTGPLTELTNLQQPGLPVQDLYPHSSTELGGVHEPLPPPPPNEELLTANNF